MANNVPERVGVVVVHGIGEQRRFEHLDWQVRCIVAALQARPKAKVTVEITRGQTSVFQAQQDTWSSGASVRIVVADPNSAKLVHIYVHEVWWADVNEPYSFSKQLRFWFWGLTVWSYPGKAATTLATRASVRVPAVAGETTRNRFFARTWVRLRLLGVGFVAVIGAASIGMITFLADRLLNLRAPDFVQVFVNYVAGVKLYNQKIRLGAGFPPEHRDFLDNLNEPPRVSIRRRMIRTLVQMAEGLTINGAKVDYDRWYVFAHSLGALVAFNGLMEAAYAWPGYFDEEFWGQLRSRGFAGPAQPHWPLPGPHEMTMPARPVWASANEVAYKSKLFEKFHGLLTFGAPLEKFAAIWPARVPLSNELAFRTGTKWFNVFDPIDPVSGVLRSFDSHDPRCSPHPENVGYAAGDVLLLNHLWYMNGPYGTGTLADAVAEWLISGRSNHISIGAGPRWFSPHSSRFRRRSLVAWAWWILAVLALTAAGSVVLPLVIRVSVEFLKAVWKTLPAML